VDEERETEKNIKRQISLGLTTAATQQNADAGQVDVSDLAEKEQDEGSVSEEEVEEEMGKTAPDPNEAVLPSGFLFYKLVTVSIRSSILYFSII